jgi:hypothetical protein
MDRPTGVQLFTRIVDAAGLITDTDAATLWADPVIR